MPTANPSSLPTSDDADREVLLLPSADGVQPDHPCQWWYWSGRLRGASGRRYGVQVAFFAAEAVRGALWGQMAHWALVDLDTPDFRSGSRVWLGAPRRIEGRFDLGTPTRDVMAVGGDGLDRLSLAVGDVALDVAARGVHVVPHYDGGRHDYAFGGYTYYYSRPRMSARGTLRRGGRDERVTGDLWFDRQFGALSSALLAGWQWFCLHLDDGTQLMIFDFNREPSERLAVVVDADGRARRLGPEAVRVAALARWRSPRSGVEYPCAWRIQTAAHDLVVRPGTCAQEMNGRDWLGPVYWEGACDVSGSHRGAAYVELLGSLAPALARATRPAAPGCEPHGWLGRALGHPTVTLALATAAGRLARRFTSMRPAFPERPTERHATIRVGLQPRAAAAQEVACAR